jgi:hypothetical protein
MAIPQAELVGARYIVPAQRLRPFLRTRHGSRNTNHGAPLSLASSLMHYFFASWVHSVIGNSVGAAGGVSAISSS